MKSVVGALTDLFLFHGSVRAVQRVLNEGLAGSSGETIYPNRIHGLLSGDETRGVNTATLELFEKALDRVNVPTAGGDRDHIRGRILRAYESEVALGPHNEDQGEAYARLGDQLEIPTGVVVGILADVGRLSPPARSPRKIRGRVPQAPDWSFQDDAVRRCLASLKSTPERKVGLVVPTGGGKTRIAMRIALRTLADAQRRDTEVVWVTHRRRLRTQARRELQRSLGDGDLPVASSDLFEKRIRFVMLHDLQSALERPEDLELVIVDEGHHAAAPSYQPLFDGRSIRGLFLTATPNRADGLPIGIDDIAYSITYRELFERGVVVEPSFDTPVTIDGLDWTRRSHLEDLADYVLGRAEGGLRKILIAVSRTEHTRILYDVLLDQLDWRANHPLIAEDIGFVHGSGNSGHVDTGEFLDEFSARPRGVLIATSQLVGEGFDDPALDGVVITYPSSSVGHLMQVAGRAMRWHEDKRGAHIVQVRPSPLAYHFEQRWLYQDISDRLRPQLDDLRYGSVSELLALVDSTLTAHRVDSRVRERIRTELETIDPPGRFNLLLTGLPFDGSEDDFASHARWGAVFVSEGNRDEFVRLFNAFSDRGADVNSYHDFLGTFRRPDQTPGSVWKSYIDMLAAMEFARKELDRVPYYGDRCRTYSPSIGTSWLKYYTFEYGPEIPAALDAFLGDVLNRDAITVMYLEQPGEWSAGVKIALPLGGCWGFALNHEQHDWLKDQRTQLSGMLSGQPPEASFAVLRRWRDSLMAAPVPLLLLDQIAQVLSEVAWAAQAVELTGCND